MSESGQSLGHSMYVGVEASEMQGLQALKNKAALFSKGFSAGGKQARIEGGYLSNYSG